MSTVWCMTGQPRAVAKAVWASVWVRRAWWRTVEPACLLYDGSRLAEQDGMTSHAEDEIGEAPMGHDLNDLWGGEVTVPADEDMGPWPVAPQIGKEPDQDHLLALTITSPTGTHQEEPYAA